jgi:amino acid adenylation domain-containing protein/FkbM family methyltransferase
MQHSTPTETSEPRQQDQYSRTQFADMPSLLELPTDRPRSAQQPFASASLDLSIDAELTDTLKRLSVQHGTTLFTIVLAAWAAVLSRLSGQEDLVIGVPTTKRSRHDAEPSQADFVNTWALRMDLSGQPTVSELLARSCKTVRAAQDEQDFSFAQVREIVQPPRRFSHVPQFQVRFVWRHKDEDAFGRPGLQARPEGVASDTVKFDQELDMAEQMGIIVGNLRYSTALFDASTIERHRGYLLSLLRGMAVDTGQIVARIDILSLPERNLLLHTGNLTEVPYPADRCIHELFEEQVRKSPDAIAVDHNEIKFTYAQLNAQANRFARRLIAQGVKPGDCVATILERSAALVAAQLAVLKVGAAYVPLDPQSPAARQEWLVADCGARTVVADDTRADRSVETLAVNLTACNARDTVNPTLSLSSLAPAYVMYTSGSTGVPKGVVVPHRAINRLVINNGYAEFLPSDRVAFAANPAFDASTMEVWGPLLNGGCTVIIDHKIFIDTPLFARALTEKRISVLFITTALFNQYAHNLPEAFAKLRYLLCGGERSDPASFKRVLLAGGPQHLIHCYGPTETTTFASTLAVQEIPSGDVGIAIGRPISNTRIYLLDAHRQPTPSGAVGEIYIGGVGVALGYLNRPELTAECFLEDPFCAEPGARMYRSGDLARYRPDGNLEFVGRRDHQVKVRGYRIELGEIEEVLVGHPQVQSVAVEVRRVGVGDERLVSYMVLRGETPCETGELREWLRQRLPEYMVPAEWVRLESLPLTPNGKVDRMALPQPQLNSSVGYVAPRTPLEETITQIWAQVLQLPQVGVFDNFFDLGGHSLIAMRAVTRVKQSFDVELPLRTLFESPTVEALARKVTELTKARKGRGPAMLRVDREQQLDLSWAQQRLWFLDRFQPDSAFYNVPMAVRLDGAIDVERLEQSLMYVVGRHDVLRTRFAMRDGRPTQLIEDDCRVRLQLIDGGGTEEAGREARRPFDLVEGPLIRAVLIRESADEHLLVLNLHHIIADAWSLEVLWRELCAFYEGLADGLSALEVQYADYAAWQRNWLQSAELAEQLAYWKQQLAALPQTIALPTDYVRPAVQSFRGALATLHLPAALSTDLRELSRQEGTTLFMTLLATLNVLLVRYSGSVDIAVATPVANRQRSELEGLIGIFLNTLVLRVDMDGNPAFRTVLQRVKASALAAYEHQDIPFECVVDELQPERSLSQTPLAQVMFAMHHTQSHASLGCARATPLTLETGTSRCDLAVVVEDASEGLRLTLEFSTDLFKPATMSRLLGHFQTLLEGVVADSGRTIWQLPMLTDDEVVELKQWNCTAREYRRDLTVASLFEEQVQLRPEAVALEEGGKQWTYAQLNCEANRVAHALMSLGVGPDMPVGICLERSAEMVAALLGVFKAGGAYVPLDPEHPAERLRWMLSDTGMNIVLTQRAFAALFSSVRVLLLDEREAAFHSDENPRRSFDDDELAYIIYTSGSTGVPKGAMNTQRGIRNRLTWMQEHYRLEPSDRVLQKTPFTFDVSVWEFFWPLIVGARLVMARPGGHRDSLYLARTILERGITVVHFVPSMLRAFLQVSEARECVSLRHVICSGEALSADLSELFLSLLSAQLHNLYGPTEAAVDVSSWECLPGIGSVMIGKPIANLQLHVLDRELNLVPLGIPGELFIGGEGLGRGYLRRPDLTADRFIPHPFSVVPGCRLYRTGDLVRLRPGGDFEFLGRLDHQVKLRGHRIELGEIEATLQQYDGVIQCAVILQDDSKIGPHLVAYIGTGVNQSGGYRLPNGQCIAHVNKSETDYLYEEIFEARTYLRNGVELTEDACVFDVGANIGIFTLFASQHAPKGRIFAFEPIEELMEALRANANSCASQVTVFQIGLGQEEKSASFTFYPAASMLSGLSEHAGETVAAVRRAVTNQYERVQRNSGAFLDRADEVIQARLLGETRTCRVRRLSDVMREEGVNRIDLLKIDVEGAEQGVLAGIDPEDWAKVEQIVVEVNDRTESDGEGRLAKLRRLVEGLGFAVTIDEYTQLQGSGLYNLFGIRSTRRRCEIGSNRSDGQGCGFTQAAIRAFLSERLPQYMLPAKYVMLPNIPLTSSGKVDRRTLPDLGVGLEPRSDATPPATTMERALIEIWCALLNLERVGVLDTFFEMGGHSLLVPQLQVRVEQSLGRHVEIIDFFRYPSIRQLASILDGTASQDLRQGVASDAELRGRQRRQRRANHDSAATATELTGSASQEELG